MKTRISNAINAQKWQGDPPLRFDLVATATNGEQVWMGVWPDKDEPVYDVPTVEEYLAANPGVTYQP